MNPLDTPPIRKNTKISFRTDEATLAKLKAICRVENTTISSLIENVLKEHVLRQETSLHVKGEKRQTPRKQCAIPAVISVRHKESMFFSNGTLLNLSMSSMQILLKKNPDDTVFHDGFHLLFSLPNHDNPLFIPCQFVRASHLQDECLVVAMFTCTDKSDNEALQKFIGSNGVISDNASRKRAKHV